MLSAECQTYSHCDSSESIAPCINYNPREASFSWHNTASSSLKIVMFCCTVPFVLGTALAFGGLSYFLYIPLNDGIEDQSQVRFLLLMTRALKGAGTVLELLGWDTAMNTTRRVSHWVMSNNKPPEIEGLTTEDYVFDGTPVRFYRPVSSTKRTPCVIYIHGGGWAIFSVGIKQGKMILEYFVKKYSVLALRSTYLRSIAEYRELGFQIVYTDETWVNKTHSMDYMWLSPDGTYKQDPANPSSKDIYDELVGDLAVKSGYIFVSIDYRLSPEYPFPIPFEDSYKASLHLMKHAREYGIDEERIGIAGDSAGGNLAAAVALKLSEADDIPKLRFQWLIYPAIQAFTFQIPSYITNAKAAPHFLETGDMISYWCRYLGIPSTPDMINALAVNNHTSKNLKQSSFAKYVDYKLLPTKYHDVMTEFVKSDTGDEELCKKVEHILLNPYFSPLMKKDLSSIPPAFVVTAEYDVLRDDGLIYAERMRRDGVDVEVYNAPNSIHGFMFWTTVMPKYSNADDVIDMFVKYSRRYM